MDQITKQRDSAIKDWIVNTFWKDKTNLILIAVIIAALILRLLFFYNSVITTGQASWWDSASYLASGQHYATGLPYELDIQRPPLFNYLIALLITFGLNEAWIIILLSLLPSVFLVYCTYLLVKEIINKRAGIIAAVFCAISWTFLFWSNRVQPDFISICFQILSVYYFWKMIKYPEKKNRYAIYAGILSAMGFHFKISALLVPIALALFVLIKDKFKAFIKKEYWIYAGSFLLCLLPYFIWAYQVFGNAMAFSTGYSSSVVNHVPFAWNTILFFQTFGLYTLFFSFLAGLVLCLRVLLYSDLIIKNQQSGFDYRILSLLILGVMLAFYIFYIRGVEDRWVFLFIPIMSLMAASAFDKIYEWGSGNYKWAITFLIIILLAFASYEHYNLAGKTIDEKKLSYIQVKEASEWIRDSTNHNEKILSVSYPQMTYYSQREIKTYSNLNSSQFEDYITKYRPTFLVVSRYEPFPPWIGLWVTDETRSVPVQAYFFDDAKTQPSLVIYKILYDNR